MRAAKFHLSVNLQAKDVIHKIVDLHNLKHVLEDVYYLRHDVPDIMDFISPNCQSLINEINFNYLEVMFRPSEQPR